MLLGKFWRFILFDDGPIFPPLLGSFTVMHVGCHSVSDAMRPASLTSCPRRSRTKFLSKPAPDLRLLPSRIQRSPIWCEFQFYVLLLFLLLLLLKKATLKGDKRNTSLHIPRVLYIYSKLLLLWFLGISRLITVSNIVSKQVQRKLGRYKNGGERKRITKENTKITEGKILQIPKFLRNMWQLKQKKNK